MPLVTLVALLAVFLVGAGVVAAGDRDAHRRSELALARQAASALRLSIGQTLAALRGARALVGPDGRVDAASFRLFADGVLQDPGVAFLWLAEAVEPAERPAFEQAVGPLRALDGTPAPRAALQLPVVAVAPADAEARGAVGVDMLTEAERATAFRRAVATGEPTVTRALRLVNGREGFVAIAPLFDRAAPTETPADRRAATVQAIGAAYGFAGLVGDTLAQLPETRTISVEQGGRVLFGPEGVDGARAGLRVGGTTWVVTVARTGGPSYLDAFVLLLGGAAVAIAVAAIHRATVERTRAVDAARREAERARRRTAALHTIADAFARARTSAEIVSTVEGSIPPETDAARARLALLDATHAARLRDGDDGVRDVPHRPVWEERDGGARATLPLLVGRRPTGALVLDWPEPRGFGDDERDFLLTLADQTAQALERTRLADIEHDLVVSLQGSLLPAVLPADGPVRVAARYRPAIHPVAIGGDWYDALTLPGGRIGVAVGDVVGHGPQAAALMGQLLSVLRGFAMDGAAPAVVLEALSRYAETQEAAVGTTAVYAIVDPEAQTVEYAAAGHPPPLVLRPGEPPAYLDGGRHLPLGAGLPGHTSETAPFPPGSTLLLYTDGAIEQPGSTLDEGLARLAQAVADVGSPAPTTLVEGVAQRLPAADDDVALVAVGFGVD